jgi:zinc/manganese transport system permease protein
VYSAVGILHYVHRDRFMLISADPETARQKGLNVRAWDFLFFFLFGVVITLSVDVAGVLIVFVFLVAPAIMAISITDRLSSQLLIGWGLGLLVTVLGLVASYVWDLPTGPAIVGCYAVVVVVFSGLLHVLRAGNRRNGLTC